MDERTKKIATVALNLARRQDWDEAARYVERLNGQAGLVEAIVCWCDTLIYGVWPEHKPGTPFAIKFWAADSGGPNETADQVDPAKAWAGRLVSYRAAWDPDAFNAVLQSLPDGTALGDGIMALLNITAACLNNAEDTRRRSDAATAELQAELSGGTS